MNYPAQMPQMPNDYFKGLSKYPERVIAGQDILELPERRLIGKTADYCNEIEYALNEALSKAEQYYNRLVELGDIVPEKTPEQKNMEFMQAMMAQMAALTVEVQQLRGEDNGKPTSNASVRDIIKDKPENSKYNKKQPPVGEPSATSDGEI